MKILENATDTVLAQNIQLQNAKDTVRKQYNDGLIDEATMITILAGINKQMGTDSFRRDGITVNVPQLEDTLKDKKDRHGNIVEKDKPSVKGGLITISGSLNGQKINGLYLQAEVLKWVFDNQDGIKAYLSQEGKEYRKIGQVSTEQGCRTHELFQ
jgi:hypothetical protein